MSTTAVMAERRRASREAVGESKKRERKRTIGGGGSINDPIDARGAVAARSDRVGGDLDVPCVLAVGRESSAYTENRRVLVRERRGRILGGRVGERRSGRRVRSGSSSRRAVGVGAASQPARPSPSTHHLTSHGNGNEGTPQGQREERSDHPGPPSGGLALLAPAVGGPPNHRRYLPFAARPSCFEVLRIHTSFSTRTHALRRLLLAAATPTAPSALRPRPSRRRRTASLSPDRLLMLDGRCVAAARPYYTHTHTARTQTPASPTVAVPRPRAYHVLYHDKPYRPSYSTHHTACTGLTTE